MLNNIQIKSLEQNKSNIAFKSTFRTNKTMQSFLEEANNSDLLSFCEVLKLLKCDGKDDDYFIRESEREVFDCLSSRFRVPKLKEITLYKQDGEDLQIKKVETFVIGDGKLEVITKDVISELTSILKRHNDIFNGAELRAETLKKINSILK